MSDQRRKYTREFKEDALRLLKSSGKTATAVAADLGIDRSLLSSWKRDFEKAGPEAFPGNGRPSAELAQIMDLKRRLAVAEEERDILKKALGYFAKLKR